MLSYVETLTSLPPQKKLKDEKIGKFIGEILKSTLLEDKDIPWLFT